MPPRNENIVIQAEEHNEEAVWEAHELQIEPELLRIQEQLLEEIRTRDKEIIKKIEPMIRESKVVADKIRKLIEVKAEYTLIKIEEATNQEELKLAYNEFKEEIKAIDGKTKDMLIKTNTILVKVSSEIETQPPNLIEVKAIIKNIKTTFGQAIEIIKNVNEKFTTKKLLIQYEDVEKQLEELNQKQQKETEQLLNKKTTDNVLDNVKSVHEIASTNGVQTPEFCNSTQNEQPNYKDLSTYSDNEVRSYIDEGQNAASSSQSIDLAKKQQPKQSQKIAQTQEKEEYEAVFQQ